MAKDLFYLGSYKNLDKLFEKIETAKAPEAFTTAFLTDVIGLKSTSDRPLINMLKELTFYLLMERDARPNPTACLRTKRLRGLHHGRVRKVYAPLFAANRESQRATNGRS